MRNSLFPCPPSVGSPSATVGRGVKELVSCAVGTPRRVSNCRASERASWERLVESELWKCIIGGRGGGKGGEGKHNKKKALHIRGKCRKRGKKRVEECRIHPEKRDSECEMQIFSFSSEDSFSFGSIGEAQSVKLARERAKGRNRGNPRHTRVLLRSTVERQNEYDGWTVHGYL